MLRACAVLGLFAVAAAAQSEKPISQPPPALDRIAVPASRPLQGGATFTATNPQYNFSYGADPNQPELPSGALWNFYMPVQVTPATPGWTTGDFGLGGLPDAFYNSPNFSAAGGTAAGGCSWNKPYDAPPYWLYDGGSTTGNQYKQLSGPILRSEAVIGSVYQSATQQVTGSGVPLYGFGATVTWEPFDYLTSPYLIGAMYYASNSCYSGDMEYGFAHYNYYDPPVDQFYFYSYSNCAAPSGATNSYGCVVPVNSKATGVGQCEAAVDLPTLPANSAGNAWYFWYAYISLDSSNGHYLFNAGVQDPYTYEPIWACTGDPLGSPTFPLSTCPQTESASYGCPTGQQSGLPFPAEQLYGALGSVTVGISNISNTPPTGRTNPMAQMTQLYIVMP